jgi:hypothetical protein
MSMGVRGVVAIGLGALTIFLAVAQFGGLISASRKGRGYSFVPFFGASFGVGACLLAPWHGSRWLVPLAFILDPTPVLFLWALVTGKFSCGVSGN